LLSRGPLSGLSRWKSEKAGAELRVSHQVQSIQIEEDRVRLLARNGKRTETFEATVGVMACGVSYRLHRELGWEPPGVYLQCAQVEVDTPVHTNGEVEIHLGRRVAPGSFAWVVPSNPNRVRVDVSTYRGAQIYLERLLGRLVREKRIVRNGEAIVQRPIPIQPIAKSYADCVVGVGDAVGQVKPVTGGGICYGLVGAEVAAQSILRTFKMSRFTAPVFRWYERTWRRDLGSHLAAGSKLRWLYQRCDDVRLERLVRLLEEREIRSLVEEKAHFDWHGAVIESLVSNPTVKESLL